MKLLALTHDLISQTLPSVEYDIVFPDVSAISAAISNNLFYSFVVWKQVHKLKYNSILNHSNN